MKTVNLAIAAIALSGVMSMAYAENAQKITTTIQQCAQEQDDSLRLNCFDLLASQLSVSVTQTPKRAVQPSSTAKIIAPVSKPKPDIQATSKAAKPEKSNDDFAKSHLEKTDEEKAAEVTEITAKITQVSKLMRGQLKITLDNGQQWQQKDSGKLRLKVGDEIILETGALNAIYLKKANENKRIRVRRIK